MDVKRIAGPVLGALLLAGVAGAIYKSSNKSAKQAQAEAKAAAVVEIKGMVGSEKVAMFQDQAFIEALAKKGFRVRADKVGSRDIAQRDISGYAFGFPSGAPAAIALQAKAKAKQAYPTFFTPMAIASWRSLAPTLRAEGVLRDGANGIHVLNMKALLGLMGKEARWSDLKGNAAYSTNKSVLVNSTSLRTSNSAAMYLALASYVANGDNVVDSLSQADKVAPLMASIFLRQGLQEDSSAGPFEDYTTMGIGKAPMVMVYESQYLEYQARRAAPNPEMELMYPQPTIYAKHIVVPFNEDGARFGALLASDPELQAIAARYGFRTSDPALFAAFLKERKLKAPEALVDVVDPPSLEILERMISSVEAKMQQ